MGGRGSSGGGGVGRGGGSKDGTIIGGKKTHIESTYIESHGFTRAQYKSEILEATTDGKGNLTFTYATPTTNTKSAQTNKTHYVTYDLQAGAQDGKTFGIDWSKVNSISGQTYSLKTAAKAAGLKWDGKAKQWRR